MEMQFFKSLANEKRQQIVFSVLSDKNEHTAGAIARAVQVAPSTASAHLAELKRGGLVIATKREREIYYRLDKDRIAAMLRHLTQWLDCC